MKKEVVHTKFSILSLILTLVFAFVIYFFALPAFNLSSVGFWIYIIVVLGIFLLLTLISNIDGKGTLVSGIKLITGLSIVIVILISGLIITNVVISPLFMSKAYSKRIKINNNASFTNDIKEVDFDKIPLLDKTSSQKLGDRVMGQMPELVSQFYVSDLYTQINYNNQIVRVTPLEYNGFFKYLANHNDGVKGYIIVNSVNGSSKLIKLEKGMKYMPTAILMEDLDRKLRFSYPTKIFGERTFELDNEGNPYWIIPTLKYTGIGALEEIDGAIVLDPITGKSDYYKVKDVPKWVDHVYNADLIINQIDDWGTYNGGFINSLFGQKNVVKTTTGYNYTVLDDDVYLYTGITSVSSDESNIGFVLVNMRTKETNFYKVPGAEEYSAMDSAKGQVQQMKYSATFPLLINLKGKPTYLISLKDNAGLVKMYAFVDVEDYQRVVVTDASKGIEEASKNYLGDDSYEVSEDKLITKDITISSISTAVISNNTNYFFTDTEGKKYYVSIEVSKSKLPFVKVGDTLTVSYDKDSDLIKINKIK